MGIKTTKKKITQTVTETSIVDDFDGSELPEDTKPHSVKLDGKTYELYLSDKNAESVLTKIEEYKTFVKDLTKGATVKGAKGGGSSAGRKSVDYKGHDFNDIRDWAVATGQKAKSGKSIEADTRILNQDIVDAYDAAQGK